MLWSTAIFSKVIESATSMTFSVIFGLSITTSLILVIGRLPFVEILLLGLVLWVTRIGSLELSLTLHTMSLR
jgi:hypothetical protein